MAAGAVARPRILQDPGYLFWAPVLTPVPTHVVTGSKFTDTWAVPWVPLGATEEGSTFSYTTSVEPITAAEFLDPIAYSTTERSGNIAFNLVDITLTNLKRAMNGGALTVVSGTGATTLSLYEAPDPGAEVRCMIGWESLDNTVRIVMRQTMNAAEIAMAFQKAPAKAAIPCQFNFEVPALGKPFSIWAAGADRG